MSLPAPLAALFLLPSLSPLLLGTKMWCRMSFLDGLMATVGAEKRIMMTNFDCCPDLLQTHVKRKRAEAKETSENERCIISALQGPQTWTANLLPPLAVARNRFVTVTATQAYSFGSHNSSLNSEA